MIDRSAVALTSVLRLLDSTRVNTTIFLRSMFFDDPRSGEIAPSSEANNGDLLSKRISRRTKCSVLVRNSGKSIPRLVSSAGYMRMMLPKIQRGAHIGDNTVVSRAGVVCSSAFRSGEPWSPFIPNSLSASRNAESSIHNEIPVLQLCSSVTYMMVRVLH